MGDAALSPTEEPCSLRSGLSNSALKTSRAKAPRPAGSGVLSQQGGPARPLPPVWGLIRAPAPDTQRLPSPSQEAGPLLSPELTPTCFTQPRLRHEPIGAASLPLCLSSACPRPLAAPWPGGDNRSPRVRSPRWVTAHSPRVRSPWLQPTSLTGGHRAGEDGWHPRGVARPQRSRGISGSARLLGHVPPPSGQVQVQNPVSPMLPRLPRPRPSDPPDRHRLSGTGLTALASSLCCPLSHCCQA